MLRTTRIVVVSNTCVKHIIQRSRRRKDGPLLVRSSGSSDRLLDLVTGQKRFTISTSKTKFQSTHCKFPINCKAEVNYRPCAIYNASPNAANSTMQDPRHNGFVLLACILSVVTPHFQTNQKVLLQAPPLRPALIWARLVHGLKVKVAYELAHKLEHLHCGEVSTNTDP